MEKVRFWIAVRDDDLFSVAETSFVDIASANINAMRMENGLEPLQTAPLLQKMCQERADELTKSYAHSRANGDAWYTILTDYGIDTNCFAGENIAAGYDTPEGVVEGWMNSAGHRKNILNTNYEYFAVGVSYYEDDPEYYFYSNCFFDANYNSNYRARTDNNADSYHFNQSFFQHFNNDHNHDSNNHASKNFYNPDR